MNGWALAGALLAAFGVGYLLRFGVCVFVCSERSLRLRFLLAEVTSDHEKCNRYIDHQERLLDQFRAGKDTGDEAEEYLRERGS